MRYKAQDPFKVAKSYFVLRERKKRQKMKSMGLYKIAVNPRLEERKTVVIGETSYRVTVPQRCISWEKAV